MQEDFHYYATYCAAYIAGYPHEEALAICYSAQLVDWCSATFLSGLKAPLSAATTQLQLEMMDARADIPSIQNITRIWASFHFLPYDLYAEVKASKRYRNKFRLLCNVNSDLLVDTVNLAKGRSLQAAGIAMHVLADTWAHRYFAGTPSLVMNNTDRFFFELIPDGDAFVERKVNFRHNPKATDNLEKGIYTNSIYQSGEQSIMNLGHGRAGHLPDYSFIRYKYQPAWGNYRMVTKDNPQEYYLAFCQMIHALKYLRGQIPAFEKAYYEEEAAAPWEAEIRKILEMRQLDACADWKALAEKISGSSVDPFTLEKYQDAYLKAPKEEKGDTFLGKFFQAALAQKGMVTHKIHKSGNLLAGYSVEPKKKGLKGFAALRNNEDATDVPAEAHDAGTVNPALPRRSRKRRQKNE